jgi:hypothetical protein
MTLVLFVLVAAQTVRAQTSFAPSKAASRAAAERKKTTPHPVKKAPRASFAAVGKRASASTAETNATGDAKFLGPILNLPGLSFADDFSKAGVAQTASGSLLGLNLLATVEAGEPRHANKAGGHSLWLTWRAPANGVVTFNTLGSLFDTVLAVYSGRDLNALTLVAANDDAPGLLTSRVQFNAVQDQEYRIAVDGFALAVGQALLNWTLDTTGEILPVITALSPNQTVGEGESLTLGVSVDTDLATFQWLFNGQPLEGETRSLLKIDQVNFDKVGSYSVRVTVGKISIASDLISVQINSTDGQVQRTAVANDQFVDVKAEQPKSSAKSGSANRGYTTTQTFSTVGATKDPGEPAHCGENGGASHWFTWQSPTNGTVVVTTDGSNFDTVLAIYIGPGDSYATLTNVACDNNGGPNGLTSRAQFKTKANTTYYIAVDGVNGAQGTVKLSIAVGAEPKIVTQPESHMIAYGGNTTLSVAAQAFPAPAFQWAFNGTNITGATNATLLLTNLTAKNLGLYRVKLTNAIGTATSAPAVLTPPKPLGISSRTLAADGFRLAIDCPPGTNYVLESSQNLTTWRALATNTTGGTFQYVDASALTNALSFYRVRPLL